MTLRRKVAIASWDSPREGNIYGKLVLDVGPALKCIERIRAERGVRVTLTHLVTCAIALTLKEPVGLNGVIRWGRFRPHSSVDLSVLVAIGGGENLSAVKLEAVDQLSITEIAEELNQRVEQTRSGRDPTFKKNMDAARWVPWFLLKPLLRVIGWASTTMGWSIPALGVRPFPFGAAIITNVGVFGVDEAYVPPTPFAGVPVYLLVGAKREAVYAEEGQVKTRQEITLTATLDHRFIDGAQAATLARKLREVFADPDAYV